MTISRNCKHEKTKSTSNIIRNGKMNRQLVKNDSCSLIEGISGESILREASQISLNSNGVKKTRPGTTQSYNVTKEKQINSNYANQ